MTACEEVQTEIEQIAGRINSRFGTFARQPVALIGTAIPFRDFVACCQTADVASITPLSDGLDLVVKTFRAAHGDGALVFPEFTGVAVELSEPVLTSRFSHRSMDSAIDQDVDMAEEEPRDRLAVLRRKGRRLRRPRLGGGAATPVRALPPAPSRDPSAAASGREATLAAAHPLAEPTSPPRADPPEGSPTASRPRASPSGRS
ncbi:MAG: trehalose-6-phosphate synthase [Paracoccaceae bacterium]